MMLKCIYITLGLNKICACRPNLKIRFSLGPIVELYECREQVSVRILVAS